MLAPALVVVAATALTAAAVALRWRHRRRARTPRRDALPAGVHLLVSRVSALSDLGLRLSVSRPPGRPRLGAVLGDR
jgi:hypothetical protein